MKRCVIVVMLMLANASLAADLPRGPSSIPQRTNIVPEGVPTAPLLVPDARWAGGLIIVVVALFVAAAVIGPIYRMSLPDEISVNYSHDEPPGSSHHHGPSGTLEFTSPEETP